MADGLRVVPIEYLATGGTLFERAHTPPADLLQLAWEMTSRLQGISTTTARALLGNSFDSTWRLMHKMRRAMGAADAAWTPMRGPSRSMRAVRGRGAVGKEMMLVIVQRAPQRGRIVMRHIDSASSDEMFPIIEKIVQPGSTIITGGLMAYQGITKLGYKHKRYPVSKLDVKAHEVLPVVHSVASKFKRTWLGTWNGGVGLSQLDWYATEFAFRHNRRHYQYKGRTFHDLVLAALRTPPRDGDSITRGQ